MVLSMGMLRREMVPGAPIVAAPLRGVALAAGIGGAGNDQGPFVGMHAQHAFASGERLQHSVDVVDLGVGTRRSVGVVHQVRGRASLPPVQG